MDLTSSQAQGWALIALNQSNLENYLLPWISVDNEMKTRYSRPKTINVWHYSDKTQDFHLIIMSCLLKKKECRSLLVATSNHLSTMKKISKRMKSTRKKESHMDTTWKRMKDKNEKIDPILYHTPKSPKWIKDLNIKKKKKKRLEHNTWNH